MMLNVLAFLKWYHKKDIEKALTEQKQRIEIETLNKDVQKLKEKQEQLTVTIAQWYADQFGHGNNK